MDQFDPRFYSNLPDGSIVENDVLRVAQELQRRYGDKVKIMYLPPEAGPGIAEEPYIICEWVEDHQSYEKIFGVWALDDRVLKKLEQLDSLSRSAADMLAQLEKDENAAKDAANAAHKDWRDNEAKPLIAAAFKSDKSFTFKNEDGKIVKLHG
jgi:hypothetical protein